MKYRGKIRQRGGNTKDDDEDEANSESTCCGIRWKHLVLLFLFIGPTFLTVLFTGSDMVMKYTGLQMPDWLRAEPPNPYRTRLMAFYRENNPSKIGEIDDLLKKYKGKEATLIRKLEKKYNTLV